MEKNWGDTPSATLTNCMKYMYLVYIKIYEMKTRVCFI